MNEIDFSAATLNFCLDGTLICIDLPKSRKKIHNDRQQSQNDVHNVHDERDVYTKHDGRDEYDKNDENDQNVITTSSWYWNNASTKLL